MRKTFFARLVLLNTFKKRIRAALVIGGIAITSSAMIVLFGVSGGLQQLVNSQVARSDAKDVITVNQRNVQQIRFDQERVSEVASVSGVGQVETSVGLLGNLIYNGSDLSIPVYAVSKDFFATSPAAFSQGDGAAVQGSNIIVSNKVLEALSIEESQAMGTAIDTTITTTKDSSSTLNEDSKTSPAQKFTVSGVVEKGDLPVAYLPLDFARTNGVDIASQLKVRVSTPEKIDNVRESIEQMGFQTSSIQDTVDQINKVFTVIQKTLLIFGFMVFGITVSGTFTIISLTLMEEMKQIGFLRVNGLRNRDVKVLFILQSIMLTTLGALFGVLLGLVGGAIVNEAAQSAASGDVFTGEITMFAVPAPQIVMVLLLSVAIGWAVGILPAKRAVMVKPLDELKG